MNNFKLIITKKKIFIINCSFSFKKKHISTKSEDKKKQVRSDENKILFKFYLHAPLKENIHHIDYLNKTFASL